MNHGLNHERTEAGASPANPNENLNERANEIAAPTFPSLLKMRCPSCQKFYSVEESWVRGAPRPGVARPPLRFECANCQTFFEALCPADGSLPAFLETLEVPLETSESTQPEPRREARRPGANVPVKNQAPRANSLTKCPKCGVKTGFDAAECRSCGVVFAKFRQAALGSAVGEVRLEGHKELIAMWAEILENYEDETRHESFVAACADADALPFAAQKYARILSAASHEEIARKMRKRVIGLSSFKAEPRGFDEGAGFRIPGMNALVIALGSATMTMGLMLPGAKNLSGIGIATIALGVGVRFFLRPPQF